MTVRLVLTPREREVLLLKCREGLNAAQIAARIFIADQTVKNHIHNARIANELRPAALCWRLAQEEVADEIRHSSTHRVATRVCAGYRVHLDRGLPVVLHRTLGTLDRTPAVAIPRRRGVVDAGSLCRPVRLRAARHQNRLSAATVATPTIGGQRL